MAILYFFGQLIGAVLGYRLLQALTPVTILEENSGQYGFCANAPHAQLSVAQSFFIEFFATLVLISVCCGVWDPRNAKNQDSVALKFGFVVTLLSFIFVSCLFGLFLV